MEDIGWMSETDSRTALEIVSSPPEEVATYKFGNASISDVVFLVGDKKFHCHKMLLAAKCDYFLSMFASGFKEKNDSSVTIHDVDPMTFKRLMEIVYNGRIENDADIFICHYGEKCGIRTKELSQHTWKTVNDLFALADRFLLTDAVRNSIESSLFRYVQKCTHQESECHHCATKLLIALSFNMDSYKEVDVSGRQAIMKAAGRLLDDSNRFSTKALHYVLNRD